MTSQPVTTYSFLSEGNTIRVFFEKSQRQNAYAGLQHLQTNELTLSNIQITSVTVSCVTGNSTHIEQGITSNDVKYKSFSNPSRFPSGSKAEHPLACSFIDSSVSISLVRSCSPYAIRESFFQKIFPSGITSTSSSHRNSISCSIWHN